MAVTLYVHAGSPACEALKRRLDEQGVAYTELDVARRRELVAELLKLTGGRRIVPVLVSGGTIEVAPHGGDPF